VIYSKILQQLRQDTLSIAINDLHKNLRNETQDAGRQSIALGSWLGVITIYQKMFSTT